MREVTELSPAQLAGQLLVVGFSGDQLPAHLCRALAERSLAGVILFRRNLPDTRHAWSLAKQVTDCTPAEFPAFIAIDQEGGRVARLRSEVLQLPAMRALGKLDDVELSERAATEQAKHLAALGINLDFAPVADVDSNPDNPVIGDRSFSPDPKLVTRHCQAFIRGLQNHGVMACLKHFPGHGDTASDSHLELPGVERPSLMLRQVELYPFERLARVSAGVMTAHVVFSAFDSVPATFSPRLCTTLLRGEFGFEGVLFSDDLQMGALSRHWSIEHSAVTAVSAGCDCLLVCSDQTAHSKAHEALTRQIETDEAFAKRCVEAVVRSVTARRQYRPAPLSSYDDVQRVMASAEARALAAELGPLF